MSSVEHITSRQNPLVGHIRRLNASRAYRRERGEFVCDGPKLLAEALRWGAEITAVVAEEGRSVPCPPGAREVSVPAELLKSLSTTETPQGVLFLARMPATAPLEKLEGRRYLVLACAYTGAPPVTEEAAYYIGRLPLPEASAYLLSQAARLRRQAQGLARRADGAGEAARLEAIAREMERTVRDNQ